MSEEEEGPLLDMPLDEDTKNAIRSLTSYPPTDYGLDAFNEYVRGPLREVLMENLGDETFLSWRTCFVAFLPQAIFLAVINLELLLVCPEVLDWPPGPTAWALGLADSVIFSCMVVPLLVPTLLHLAHVLESRVSSGHIQVLLMSLGGFLITTFVILLGNAACGALDAAVITRSFEWLAAFLLFIDELHSCSLLHLFSASRDCAGLAADWPKAACCEMLHGTDMSLRVLRVSSDPEAVGALRL